MAKTNFEAFEEKDISRIFIAKNLNEAKIIEKLLAENNIEYAINIEPFQPKSLLQFELRGAAFYVLSGQGDFCRQIIVEEGLVAGIVF